VAVKESELNTLGHEWCLGEDGTHCLLHETFADSEALLTHLDNVRPSLSELLEIAPITRLEVLGSASAAARRAFCEECRTRPLDVRAGNTT